MFFNANFGVTNLRLEKDFRYFCSSLHADAALENRYAATHSTEHRSIVLSYCDIFEKQVYCKI